MLNTPFNWEYYIGTQLKTVDQIAAASSVWWYICHIAWLQNGVFPDPPHENVPASTTKR